MKDWGWTANMVEDCRMEGTLWMGCAKGGSSVAGDTWRKDERHWNRPANERTSPLRMKYGEHWRRGVRRNG